MENNFSANLRSLRKKNGFTLETLGKRLNISKSTLSDYETGKSSPPFEVCERIADVFGITIDELRVSDISEKIVLNSAFSPTLKGGGFKNDEEKATLIAQKNQLEFQNKILSQQIEGLQVQLKLVNQILESKSNEIRSLQMQIKLLDAYLEEFRLH
ncbi:MAG: helix-turn-helix domain-containing protein [Runella sp.]